MDIVKDNYRNMKKDKQYKLKKDLFPIGTILSEGPTRHIVYGHPVLYEVSVGISKNEIVSMFVDEDIILEHPDYFEEVK